MTPVLSIIRVRNAFRSWSYNTFSNFIPPQSNRIGGDATCVGVTIMKIWISQTVNCPIFVYVLFDKKYYCRNYSHKKEWTVHGPI